MAEVVSLKSRDDVVTQLGYRIREFLAHGVAVCKHGECFSEDDLEDARYIIDRALAEEENV